ncbi:hypothetical protein C5E44_34370 [Nocardia nova]|nr:hypothetical protein C5E44_34370 [Nocardia nova]
MNWLPVNDVVLTRSIEFAQSYAITIGDGVGVDDAPQRSTSGAGSLTACVGPVHFGSYVCRGNALIITVHQIRVELIRQCEFLVQHFSLGREFGGLQPDTLQVVY